MASVLRSKRTRISSVTPLPRHLRRVVEEVRRDDDARGEVARREGVRAGPSDRAEAAPLAHARVEEAEGEEEVVEKMVVEAVSAIPAPEPVARPVAEALVQSYIASRRALPDRKNSVNIKAKIGNHSVRLITGEYPDGQLGEIFLLTSKEGAAWRALLSQFAIAVSIGLQHGVPIDAFIKSFTFSKFEPSGMIQGGSGRVKMSSSIIDWVFRELAIEYAGRNDLAHMDAEALDIAHPLPWKPTSSITPSTTFRERVI